MGDLSSAVAGTKIKVPEQYGRSFSVRVVTSVTAANVMCEGRRFRKTDGLLIGSSGGWGRTFASIATEADIVTYRTACAKSRLQFIKVTAENLEIIERLIAESERA